MSHYTVLVIGNDPEEQLEPYWELDLTQEEMRNDFRAEFISKDVEIRANWHDQSFFTSDYVKENYPERFEKSPSEVFRDIETFVKDWYGYICDEDTGEVGYFANPNAKWDWYQLGGRWTGVFELKPESIGEGNLGESGLMTQKITTPNRADQAIKGDIDFHAMRQRDGEAFSVFAVLKDGIWYEQGEMGWFGLVSNEKNKNDWQTEFEMLINNLPDDTLLSVYDCHI